MLVLKLLVYETKVVHKNAGKSKRERVREGEGKRETVRERSTQFGGSINGPFRGIGGWFRKDGVFFVKYSRTYVLNTVSLLRTYELELWSNWLNLILFWRVNSKLKYLILPLEIISHR